MSYIHTRVDSSTLSQSKKIKENAFNGVNNFLGA